MKRCVFPHNNDAQALEKRSYARSVPCGAGDGVSAALTGERQRPGPCVIPENTRGTGS